MEFNRISPEVYQAIADHKASKLTDWYDADQLPTRTGVYECERTLNKLVPLFRYFDGERWYYGGETPWLAFFHFQTMGVVIYDVTRWRGLREQA